MVELNNIPKKKQSFEKIKREKKKKDVLVGLNIERTKKIKAWLKNDPDNKVTFSKLMDYLLKQFYNQFEKQINEKTKEGGKEN